MRKWGFHIWGTLLFILLCLPAARLEASPLLQDSEPEKEIPDCRKCHQSIYTIWEESAHGRGLSCGQCHLANDENHARQGHGAQGGAKECMACHTTGYDPIADTWEEDNIHCIACHAPVQINHPNMPMPTNRSEELCGQCHIQARFEWQNSQHGRAGVACISCHSQHRTSLKSDSVIDQCASCHHTFTDGFSHSTHNSEGLSCADCHLAPIEGPVGEGSAKRDHTFDVDVSVCVSCHMNGLHDDGQATIVAITFQNNKRIPLNAMSSSVNAEVSEQPPEINPFGVMALIGICLGVIGGGLVTAVFLTTRSIFRRRTAS